MNAGAVLCSAVSASRSQRQSLSGRVHQWHGQYLVDTKLTQCFLHLQAYNSATADKRTTSQKSWDKAQVSCKQKSS